MKTKYISLLLILLCSTSIKAEDYKNTLITIYSKTCSYSIDLVENTLTNKEVKKAIQENYNYLLLEENTVKAQAYITQFNITSFPTQIVINKKFKPIFALGLQSVEDEMLFLQYAKELEKVKGTEDLQQLDAYEKYVFRSSSLGYNPKTKKLLTPSTTKNKPYRSCRFEEKPEHFACIGGGGSIPSRNFIDEGTKKGDFKVAVFHPVEKRLFGLRVSIATSVENGKVTKQTACNYRSHHVGSLSDPNFHHYIDQFRCIVATSKFCNSMTTLDTEENATSKVAFQKFKNYLYNEYQDEVLKSYKFSFEKAFLSINVGRNYDHYINTKYAKYTLDKQDKSTSTGVLSLTDLETVKKSKTFAEMMTTMSDKEFDLFERFIEKTCDTLREANILSDK